MAHLIDNGTSCLTGSGPAQRRIDDSLNPVHFLPGERVFNPDKPGEAVVDVDFQVNCRMAGSTTIARMFGAWLVSQGFTNVTVDGQEPWDEEAIRTFGMGNSSRETIDAQKHVQVKIKTNRPNSLPNE